jgi:UDP-N-acetylmuramoyl-L-alanyl-D-glutamate--2,6-diaminopimelate ligase
VAERRLKVDAAQLIVGDSRHAMALFAHHFYGYPSQEMKVIGVTGTNGKTTVTWLLEKIFADRGARTGLMGTIRMKIGDSYHEMKNTTPDALELARSFRRMRDAGTDYCVMEVSSHALALGRVKGVDFRTAIFTNLTQDHLDFHGTMERYREAKGLFFSRLGNTYSADPDRRKYAVLNADDDASDYFRSLTAAQVITYGIDRKADIRAENVRVTLQGTTFDLVSFAGSARFSLQLIGKFSVYNALAAIGAALCEGIPLEDIRRSLEEMSGVDGRFQAVQAGQPFLVLVDYAHTPDSLENVLATIREFAKGRIYCVFGCGGDRDRGKRPIMGRIAARLSDYVILTSDNPRTEDPEKILLDIEQGVIEEGLDPSRYASIPDRALAIQKAVEMAGPEDVVLIAGKGHETYQEINGVRFPFDDRAVAEQAIRSRMK